MFFLFFFNDTATTEIYTLSLHDALPISQLELAAECRDLGDFDAARRIVGDVLARTPHELNAWRSEEHTSELQSRQYLVCRLMLEKKKKNTSECSHILSTNMLRPSTGSLY